MVKLVKPAKVKTVKKDICTSLHNGIKRLQKDLQREHNIKYGRKAGAIPYGYASKQFMQRYCK